MSRPVRPWTPARLLDGLDRMTTVKRSCDGCGLTLGDSTPAEVDGATGEVGECPRCRGLHVVFADPDVDPTVGDLDDPAWVEGTRYRVLCPHMSGGVSPCAVWVPCGCPAMWVKHCPASPTGEHQEFAEHGFVGMPLPGTCWWETAPGVAAAAAQVTRGVPGVYGVELDVEDDGAPLVTLVLVGGDRS